MDTNEATGEQPEPRGRGKTITYPHMIQVNVSAVNYEQLKARAARYGRTLAEEVRQNLTAAEHVEEERNAVK